MIDIDDLEVESVAFELRYNNVYRLWDTSGTIWAEMASKHPELSVTNIQPNQQLFDTPKYQISLELGLFRVISRGSEAIDQVVTISSDIYAALDHNIRLTSFSRSGLRIMQSKTFESTSEAMTYCGSAQPVGNTSTKGLGTRVGFVSGNRYEGESSGLNATLKVEERNINLNVQWDAIPYFKPLKEKKIVVVTDTDYYTIGTIDRETLDVSTWIYQASKAIKRFWGVL
jgi:hypothetical protein